jgi:hypothetical protein
LYVFALLFLSVNAKRAGAERQERLTLVEAAMQCTTRRNAPVFKAQIDPIKAHHLEELIDIAERKKSEDTDRLEVRQASGQSSRHRTQQLFSAVNGFGALGRSGVVAHQHSANMTSSELRL